MQTNHYLPRPLPEALQGLATLALDLRWSWNHGADVLWKKVAPELWQATANPWLILETVSEKRLQSLAEDADFLQILQLQLDSRETHFEAKSWFSETIGEQFSGHIAYFSMEFGVCESLPIYSGGLGVLAGDYLKTACDLNVPIIGVGLLYQQGYFRQAFSPDGEQIEFYPYNDPSSLPVVPLRDDAGEWVHVSLVLRGRPLRLRAWRGQVGRRTLMLLDSNDLLNDPDQRAITSELYGGGSELRLQQEIVLGIGGWRLLETLGLDCPVCHLNEGHAAFATLERARFYQERTSQSFAAALQVTRAGNIFTTHTPVAAGFDRFSPTLFSVYLAPLAADLGVPLAELLALGRLNATDAEEPFNMAYLAMRGVGAVNGVSRLHGAVSRDIFQPLFPHWPPSEVPIGHVTNGVHVPSWDSAAADTLWTQSCGKQRWLGTLASVETELLQVNDEELWRFRTEGRQRLIGFLRQRRTRRRVAGDNKPVNELFDPDVLTLGFARRFAEYKRPNLLLHDVQRLVRLLTHRDRPVQLVIAGKAHPQDQVGKGLLYQWQRFIAENGMSERVMFVEDYDLGVAAQLVQGVDVWVNTPRRPWEASGTSGMKVLVNGGLNLSELDGWWAEAYAEELGWAVGDAQEHADSIVWDAREAEQLYRLLEDEVVPAFYQRNEQGLPLAWVARMRESMSRLTAQYSSNRMLREYTEKYYLPLAENYHQRSGDSAVAEGLLTWQRRLEKHWQWLHFGNVTSREEGGEHCFEVQVYLDDLPVEAVTVELYAQPLSAGEPALCQVLNRGDVLAGAANAFLYTARVSADRPATDYTPRVIPSHPLARVPLESQLILWYR